MLRLPSILLLAGIAQLSWASTEVYDIEPKHSMPRFEYNHLGYSTQISRFDKVSGKITIDRVKHTGSIEVEIDTKSVNTGSDLFNQHIQATDFFDTENYPSITFKSNNMKFEQDQPKSVTGELTIKGVTKTVTLDITSFKCMPHPMVKKDACGANAQTTIKRSDFNMGKYAPAVSDEVILSLPVEAIKQ